MMSSLGLGNLLPRGIEGEADSVRNELLRILGNTNSEGSTNAAIDIDVCCERVDRKHGHLARVDVILERDASAHEVVQIWSKHTSRAQALDLPSACQEPIHFVSDPNNVEESRWEGGETRSPGDDLRAAMAVAVGDIAADQAARGTRRPAAALASQTADEVAAGARSRPRPSVPAPPLLPPASAAPAAAVPASSPAAPPP